MFFITNKFTITNNGIDALIEKSYSYPNLKNGIINRENAEYQYVIDLSKYHINIHLYKENVDLEIRVNILEKKYNLEHLYIVV